MAYVDAFVLAVPKHSLEAYKAMARRSASSWIVYESREQRDAVNAKVMADRGIHGRRLHTIFSDQFSLFLRGMLGSGAKTASDRQRNSQSALH
jgi:uncharacterized protein YbaA (DUF1428 family)